jgi:hypothetical protein
MATASLSLGPIEVVGKSHLPGWKAECSQELTASISPDGSDWERELVYHPVDEGFCTVAGQAKGNASHAPAGGAVPSDEAEHLLPSCGFQVCPPAAPSMTCVDA